MFDDFMTEQTEYYLSGTLVVRAVRRKDGRPAAGVKVRIGGSEEEACGKG